MILKMVRLHLHRLLKRMAEAEIKLYGGVSGDADEAVNAYLEGKLDFNPNVQCSHHAHEHSCGGHQCGEDKHGCSGN